MDNDENLSKSILAKLTTQREISYDRIALAAFEQGRSALATKVLNICINH